MNIGLLTGERRKGRLLIRRQDQRRPVAAVLFCSRSDLLGGLLAPFHLGCTVYMGKTYKREIYFPFLGYSRTLHGCVYISIYNIYYIYINIYNTDFREIRPHDITFFLICAKNVFSERILFSYSDVLSLICKCFSLRHFSTHRNL